MKAAVLALALGAGAAGALAHAAQARDAELLKRYLGQVEAKDASNLVPGNEVRLLVDGPQTHRAMFEAMAAARDHINLESYILEDGDIGERLATLLQRKVAQGVKVHVSYDSIGSIKTPREYFGRLRAAGVAVCEFNPVNPMRASIGWNLNNRNHRKVLVVDGRVAFTGGINLSSTYASGSSSPRRSQDVKAGEESDKGWRDTHVRVEGPVVERFQRLFLDGWALQDCGPWKEANFYPGAQKKGDKVARVLANEPSGKSEMHAALLNAIAVARERVWLTIGYFVPDPATRNRLVEAARRGVDVRLVLPGFSDFWAPVYAARSHYEDLLAAGVRIYEWHEALMHAKTAVIDSVWASVGSTNLDWRSFVHNYEADLIVVDPAFGRELESRFRKDIERSVEIRLDEWQKRGQGERFKEWLARRWEYLL